MPLLCCWLLENVYLRDFHLFLLHLFLFRGMETTWKEINRCRCFVDKRTMNCYLVVISLSLLHDATLKSEAICQLSSRPEYGSHTFLYSGVFIWFICLLNVNIWYASLNAKHELNVTCKLMEFISDQSWKY